MTVAGGQTAEFRAASNVDVTSDQYYSSWYDNPQLGHRSEGIIIDFETTSDMTVYRFHRSSDPDHQYGPWFTDSEEINQLINQGADPMEIRNRFAIPTDSEVDRVSTLNIESGTSMRVGTTDRWGDMSGGGTQYEVRHPDMQKKVDNLAQDDFPGTWSESPAELEDFLQEGEIPE